MDIAKGEIEGATVAFAAVNGLSATEKYSTVIAEANRLQYSQAELMAFQAVINDKFAPKFHIKPKDLSRLPAVQDRYTALKGEWSEKYCTLCKKYFGASHETSAEHISRLDEMTAGDEMIGPCHAGSSRRFSDTPGLPRFLSQSLLKAYWGQDVQSMIALVWHRLRVGGVKLEAAIPGWGKSKRLISADEVSGIGMGAVTYPGSGKYDPCVDVAVRWEDMVADLPPDMGRFERLIDDECKKEGIFKAPDGRGWWPICIASWKTEASDRGFRGTPQEYRVRQQMGLCVVWALCWYQLLDGTWVLCLWPVYLLSRL
jgi:hypothetical protein